MKKLFNKLAWKAPTAIPISWKQWKRKLSKLQRLLLP